MKLLDHLRESPCNAAPLCPVPFRMPTETPDDPLTPRDPEDRPVSHNDEHATARKTLDKTLADSFPTSDPPSSIPDPDAEED